MAGKGTDFYLLESWKVEKLEGYLMLQFAESSFLFVHFKLL